VIEDNVPVTPQPRNPDPVVDALSADAVLEALGPSDADRPRDPIAQLLRDAGLADVDAATPLAAIETALRKVVASLNGADALRRAAVREEAVARLRAANVGAATRLVDAALGATAAPDDAQGHAAGSARATA